MTHITHATYYNEHILECSGHAGFAKKGHDILCAAVSIICYTVAAYLKEAEAKGLISGFLCDISQGYANIRFSCKRGGEAEKCFFAIINGFKFLAESFPDHILYEE